MSSDVRHITRRVVDRDTQRALIAAVFSSGSSRDAAGRLGIPAERVSHTISEAYASQYDLPNLDDRARVRDCITCSNAIISQRAVHRVCRPCRGDAGMSEDAA